MFKKKPTIKPLAPIRSSDRRKTADLIISDYGLEARSTDKTSAEEQVDAATRQRNLRNSLLPDNIQSARFTTTHGPDLKQVSGTVYVGNYPGGDVRILWFRVEDKMYPSVYTLWRHPGLLPLLHTPDVVVKKLQGGADLMTPGLAAGPPFPPKAIQGAIVAIAGTDRPSVPVAVGSCLIDVSSLQSVQGARGHAVQIMHWAGDELWSYSTSGKVGISPPEQLDGWLAEEADVKDLEEKTADLQVDDEDEDGGVALDSHAGQQQADTASATDGALEGQEVKQMSTQGQSAINEDDTVTDVRLEIDDAFRNAFLYGLYHHKNTNMGQPHFGLVFPITQSLVMSNLIQPFLPAYSPEDSNALQMKKTSFKNIKKFLRTFDKAKLLKTKERDGHETTIVDVNFEDKSIVDFKPYPLPRKETSASTGPGRGEQITTGADTGDSSIGQKLSITQYYKPKDRLLPIFASAEASSHSLFTGPELRPIITSYIESEHLVSDTNKRLVTLNPILANAVFDGSARLDKEVLAKGSVPRDALIDRIILSCSAYHAITRAGQPANDKDKPRAGAPPRVRVTLETRSGSKTVTKVSGLEAFFIPPQPLADELRRTCAGSTSVEQLAGSSPKTPVMEIMVQGPQRDAVLKALERRGVRTGWIEVLDKVKKKN